MRGGLNGVIELTLNSESGFSEYERNRETIFRNIGTLSSFQKSIEGLECHFEMPEITASSPDKLATAFLHENWVAILTCYLLPNPYSVTHCYCEICFPSISEDSLVYFAIIISLLCLVLIFSS